MKIQPAALAIVSVAVLASSCSECCLPDDTVELEAPNWAQELGWGPDDTVLVLHADDAGMLEAANDAIEASLGGGHIDSASVMMPTEKASEFVDWAEADPSRDVGVHLTLVSEFESKRWGPVAPASSVSSLVDASGHFHQSGPMTADAGHVRTEIRAQIEAAKAAGLEPTHLDSHVGSLFLRADYFREYVCAAVDYEIPPVLFEDYEKSLACLSGVEGIPLDDLSAALEDWVNALAPHSPYPRLDAYCAVPKAADIADDAGLDEVAQAFVDRAQGLGPGLYQFLFHPALETVELKNLTSSWPQRVIESVLFEHPTVTSYLGGPDVYRTNWQKILCRWECAPCDTDPWTPPPRCP